DCPDRGCACFYLADSRLGRLDRALVTSVPVCSAPSHEQYLAAAPGGRRGRELFGRRFSLADYRLRVSRTTSLAMGFVAAPGGADIYRGLCLSGLAASDRSDSVCHPLCIGL